MDAIEIRKLYGAGNISKKEYIDYMQEWYKQGLYEMPWLMENKDIESIVIKEGGIEFTEKKYGIRFWWDVEDTRNIPIEILNFGSFELEESEYIISMLNKIENPVFLDIGANIGWYSMLVNKEVKNSVIHAYEPCKETYNRFVFNCILNNAKYIDIKSYGLSDEEGEKPFYKNKILSGNSSLEPLTANHTLEYSYFRRLDNIEFGRIDFIKCDVEGAEYLVLKGAENTIRKHKPIIMVELVDKWMKCFNYSIKDVVDFMKSIGYSCHMLENGTLIPVMDMPVYNKINYFFVYGGDK
jgi:FkbM family methyltransferase